MAPGPIWTPLIPSTFPEEKISKFDQSAPMQVSDTLVVVVVVVIVVVATAVAASAHPFLPSITCATKKLQGERYSGMDTCGRYSFCFCSTHPMLALCSFLSLSLSRLLLLSLVWLTHSEWVSPVNVVLPMCSWLVTTHPSSPVKSSTPTAALCSMVE